METCGGGMFIMFFLHSGWSGQGGYVGYAVLGADVGVAPAAVGLAVGLVGAAVGGGGEHAFFGSLQAVGQ